MKIWTTASISYKAKHHVAKLGDEHAAPHWHVWTVTLLYDYPVNAHEVQQAAHLVAPHFGDHGDMAAESVAAWWQRSMKAAGFTPGGVRLLRNDGVGAEVARS